MRTRASAPPVDQTPSSASSTPPVKPCKTFILPSSAGQDARFIQLPHPRTGEVTRYFFCPRLGLYEFTVVSSSPHDPRSTLFTNKRKEPEAETTSNGENEKTPTEGTISKSAELLIATPIDIIFFLIPFLSASKTKTLFQPLDDIIDSHDNLPKHLRYVLYNDTFRDTLEKRMNATCDSVEAGDEKMFRFSEAKLLNELVAKAERMAALGLPASLEERFIKQALAKPLMSVARPDANTNTSTSTESNSAPSHPEESDESAESQSQDKDSQISAATSVTPSTSVSTPACESPATPAEEQIPEESATPIEVVHLRRVFIALSFMKESYISPDFCGMLDAKLATPESPIDFKPLHDHLKHLTQLRAEAQASRSFGDMSRKRTAEDEDAAETRAEKKRRKEEEEKKKKAGESRGVRDLKKVNTSGMKKMSDFFGKAAPKKKS